MATIRYAKGPVVYLYDKDDLKTKKRELLWGDWLRIGDDIDGKWSEVQWGRNTFAIRKEDYQEERLCEMIFLDVGQGDGCILTTPVRPAGEIRSGPPFRVQAPARVSRAQLLDLSALVPRGTSRDWEAP